MIKYFLVLTLWNNANPQSITIPQYYETKQSCKDAAQEAVEGYTGSGYVGYTCVPWNSEGD